MWRRKEETLSCKLHDSIKSRFPLFCSTYYLFVPLFRAMTRSETLATQETVQVFPLKFVVVGAHNLGSGLLVVETFLFPHPRLFSSRPIKCLIIILLAMALA